MDKSIAMVTASEWNSFYEELIPEKLCGSDYSWMNTRWQSKRNIACTATQKINFNFSLEKSDHKSSIAISKQESLVSKQRIKYKEITAVIKVFII